MFSFKKMLMKISSAKWRPFCPGKEELLKRLSLNVISTISRTVPPKICHSYKGTDSVVVVLVLRLIFGHSATLTTKCVKPIAIKFCLASNFYGNRYLRSLVSITTENQPLHLFVYTVVKIGYFVANGSCFKELCRVSTHLLVKLNYWPCHTKWFFS